MATESLNFNLLANDRASRVFDKFGRTVDDTESKVSKVGRGMLAVGKVAAVGLVAGVGAGALAFKKFTGDARESERVTKLTEAIIKSTGGAAKISAKQVAELSTSISNKTGVDDEAIQTGSNLLLTFKNVRNEVGKGNKIFNEATAAAVDLSAAGFGSIESASKMLGKALNDPIAGITALSRAGVTFSEQQKEQIKTLVESGDILKAQNLIMHEVKSQVGGAAAATGTAMDKLKVRLGNISEEIGSRLLPHVDRAAAWLGDRLPGAFDKASAFAGPLLTKLGEIGPKILAKIQEWAGYFKTAFDNVVVNVAPIVTQVRAGIKSGLGVVGEFVTTVKTAIDSGDWGPVGQSIGTALAAAVQGAAGAVGKIGAAIGNFLSKIDWLDLGIKLGKQAIPLFVGLAIGLLNVDLGALLVGIVSHWQEALWAVLAIWLAPAKFVGQVGKLLGRIPFVGKLLEWGLNALKGWVDKMGGAVLRFLGDIGGAFLSGFRSVFPNVGRGLAEGLALLPLRIGVAALDLVQAAARMMGRLRQAILDRIESVIGALFRLVERLTTPFRGMASLLLQAGKDLVMGFVNGIKSLAGAALSAARDLAASAINAVKDKLKIFSPSKVMIELGEFFSEGFAGGVRKGTKSALEAVGELMEKVKSKLSDLRSQASQIRSTAANAVRGALDVGGLGATTTSTDAEGNQVSTTARVTDQVSAFRQQAAAFSAAISAAVSKGVNSNLIAQVANLGPTQGLVAAQALAAMNAAEVNQVNRDLAVADKFAAKVGATVLTTTSLPTDIKRQEATLTALKDIKRELSEGKTILHVHGSVVTEKDLVRMVRDGIRELDRRRG